ncbi:DUF3486 family protein [bacterium]|nr:DUF3486 family protein [bacterium]
MGRKSSVDVLPRAIRDKLGKLLKAGTLTLDQIVSELKADLGEEAPSRTAVWRYKDRIDNVMKGVREKREIARVWVQELGASPESDQGRMLVEMMQSMLTDTVIAAQDGEPLDPKTARELALAIKAAAEAGGLSLKQQDLIEARARERLQREQQEKLNALQAKGKIDSDTLATIRRDLYGLPA